MSYAKLAYEKYYGREWDSISPYLKEEWENAVNDFQDRKCNFGFELYNLLGWSLAISKATCCWSGLNGWESEPNDEKQVWDEIAQLLIAEREKDPSLLERFQKQ